MSPSSTMKDLTRHGDLISLPSQRRDDVQEQDDNKVDGKFNLLSYSTLNDECVSIETGKSQNIKFEKIDGSKNDNVLPPSAPFDVSDDFNDEKFSAGQLNLFNCFTKRMK